MERKGYLNPSLLHRFAVSSGLPSGGSRGGGGGGGSGPPPPISPETCLTLKLLHRPGSHITIQLVDFFLMKRALQFATNSKHIQECNCLGVPFNGLFTSACKAVFAGETRQY